MLKISKSKKICNDIALIYILNERDQLQDLSLTIDETNYIERNFKQEGCQLIQLPSVIKPVFIVISKSKKTDFERNEELRKHGHSIYKAILDEKFTCAGIIDLAQNKDSMHLLEGLMLSSYEFTKYLKPKEFLEPKLENIEINSQNIDDADIHNLKAIVSGVFYARNIVNEPLSFMSAKKLSQEIVRIGISHGFKTEVFDKKRIESLKMGGLLAVNRGSVDPPTFSILSWEPENAVNKKPIVFVGKGLVFDTGGINLKPSGSLDTMKSDKAGAAAVIGAIAAISEAKLPIKVIGLIPATDNRPGNNAYVPQDIIKMFDGTSVEVLNTDAEGRLILADALGYAKKYDPELVIDIATLTGAAVVAIGINATAVMGNDKESINKIIKSGFNTYERLVELPLWNDYKEQLKSELADLKNIGGRWGGAITAGKFLEHFTDYNWIHLDIAGPAFNETKDSYRGIGGSGVGVRLLFNYILNKINER